ncbi:hypothetical protein BS47DRAFT_1348644 [Hydnum rufescens UP504]|uniref:Uncharacterized protein n=1 Tax=Hydnum rufescens UP504 TaxID=1448309 RepID=A0A9P6AQ64_9AGAM|nr:hypothetical protein BS47DRAFT_1348644 [Hydnum rufescens UP504]
MRMRAYPVGLNPLLNGFVPHAIHTNACKAYNPEAVTKDYTFSVVSLTITGVTWPAN